MSKADAQIDADGKGQPSHRAVEEDNPAILKPKWLVLDDINIDLLSVITIVSALASIFFFGYKASAVVPLAAGVVIALRTLFPRPAVPEGTVLITGGSSGIGAELSYIFASKGHDVVLVGRIQEQLEAVKSNIKDRYKRDVYTVSLDLSLPGAAQKLYDHVKDQGLIIDVLVNDAALGAAGDTFDQPLELVERMVTLNCITLVQLTQLFGEDMMSRGRGWILQLSSVLGWMATPGQNIYHATKHFVRSYCEALSIELRAHPNLVLTQLMPGPVRTQFVTRAHAEDTFIFAASHTVEEPRDVAMAGYEGLCKRKRMVFSSWNAAFTATMMHLLPRSMHLTLARLTMAPVHGMARAAEPVHDQKTRKQELGHTQN